MNERVAERPSFRVSEGRTPLPAGPSNDPCAVTGVVVARNEEENIEECMQSLLWADRILLIDNGSTDRTEEIATRYTQWIVKRHVPPGIDPIHDNLNYGFDLIPTGWIVHLDADERVSPRLASEIREASTGTESAAFYVPFRIAMLGRWIQWGYWGLASKQIRVFRAQRARYPMRALHELVEVDGAIGRLLGAIYHRPFPNIEQFVMKMNRYTTLEADLILNGTSPGVTGMGRKAASPPGARLFWASARLFLWSYIRLKGWKEGRIGLATSGLLALYGFLEALKAWEKASGASGALPLPPEAFDHPPKGDSR